MCTAYDNNDTPADRCAKRRGSGFVVSAAEGSLALAFGLPTGRSPRMLPEPGNKAYESTM